MMQETCFDDQTALGLRREAGDEEEEDPLIGLLTQELLNDLPSPDFGKIGEGLHQHSAWDDSLLAAKRLDGGDDDAEGNGDQGCFGEREVNGDGFKLFDLLPSFPPPQEEEALHAHGRQHNAPPLLPCPDQLDFYSAPPPLSDGCRVDVAKVISRPKDRVVTFASTTQVIQMPWSSHLHDRFVTTLGTLDADKALAHKPANSDSSVKRFHDLNADTASYQTSLTHTTCAAPDNMAKSSETFGQPGGRGRREVIMRLERIIKSFVVEEKCPPGGAGVAAAGTSRSESHGDADASGGKSEDKSNTTVLRYGGHKFKGVTKHRCTGRWEAHIWDQGKQVYLGGFSSSTAAARAYDLVAVKCKKKNLTEKALNFPLETYTHIVEDIRCASKDELVSALRRKSCGFARGTSRFRGVTRRSQNGRWEARSAALGKRKYIYLGTFDSEEEAARAYDRTSIRNHGFNAVTNFDISEYDNEMAALIASGASHSSSTSSVSDKSSTSSCKRKRGSRQATKQKERKTIRSPMLGNRGKFMVEQGIDDYLIPKLHVPAMESPRARTDPACAFLVEEQGPYDSSGKGGKDFFASAFEGPVKGEPDDKGADQLQFFI
ncbi:AP2 domain-containing protein [Chloropicon primus]|uniref:AP2 domain-containing protein n=2 Tax=Chloropicon primus TaxID=1764295 RepID=A0A5B8MHL4_9CHLO|nr:AP2 domain-containing protein [Chloropicon primus]UPQ98353.1 AP2 domain-containing protein [Chloropicon primus]|eukprot:QDZ19145.1 AP2 domain-containing protein [Chloropicon primus]